MRALDLDYRSRAPGPGRLAWLALLLAGLACALLVAQYLDLAAESAARQDELDRLSQGDRPGQPAGDPARARRVSLEMNQARAVMDELALPWDGLFSAVEASDSREVALLAITPELDQGQGRIAIVGEAKSYVAVLAYIRGLEASDALERVHLQSHQVQTQDSEHPVRFTLAANWRGR
jgi:Tfp pilus assembly protein PilN